MKIIIDYRETQLYTSCISLKMREEIYKDIEIVTENLPLGDIIICNDENKELMIIERKTLSDLASSIQDSRYKEQGYRLLETEIPNHYIVYLIEGDITRYHPKVFQKKQQRIDRKCLLSAITSIIYEKGFSVYKTLDVDESAMWLLHTTYKIKKSNYKGYYYNLNDININKINTDENNKKIDQDIKDNTNTNTNDYLSVMKKTKKNYITQDNIFSIMISQIPGVSSNIANILSETFKNMKDFIQIISNDIHALDNIYIPLKNGEKKKKLSKNVISNIYSYILQQNNEIKVDI